MPKLIICDDHQIVTDGLRSLIQTEPGWQVITTVSNGRELLDTLRLVSPDLVLLDIDMPVLNGIETMRIIQEKHSRLKVVVLTMHDEPSMVKKFMNLGAKAYLPKNADRETFFEVLKDVIEGKSRFDAANTPPQAQKPMQSYENSIAMLTDRESEIIRLIASGFSNKEIAAKLDISHRTVDTHRTNIMKKLNINNVAGLVRYAYQHGLL